MIDALELAREKLAAMRAVSADREYASRRLDNVDSRDLLLELQHDPRLRTVGGLQAILDRANVESRRDINIARQLVELILKIAPLLPSVDAVTVLRGRALRIRAYVAREDRAVGEARAFLAEAQELLATTPAGAIEREYARLLDAYILSELGEHHEALRLVQNAIDTFEVIGDRKGKMQALLTAGAIHFESQDYELAAAAYLKALPIAEAVRDNLACALVHANLGHCAARFGQAGIALTHFAHALPIFDALGTSADRDRIIWAMAKLAMQQERVVDAARQFSAVREEFLRQGMFLSAAFVALDFAEFLVKYHQREAAREWCKDLVQTFAAAGMPHPMLRALQYMERCADVHELDLQVLGRIRNDLREHLPAA
jgi:tetratricopeptide (TPR) repeat protein